MTAATRANTHTSSLEDYVDAVKRHWLVVVAIALVCGGAAFLIGSSGAATYSASARVDVGPTPVGSIDGRLVVPNLGREAEVIVSDRLTATVADRLDLDPTDLSIRRPLDVRFVPDGSVLRLSYSARSGEVAAERVNAFATAYVDDRLAQQANYHFLATETLRRQIADFADELASIQTQIDELDAQRRFILSTEVSASDEAELVGLTAERGVLLTQRETTLVKIQDLEIALVGAGGLEDSEAPAAELTQFASVPSVPEGTSPRVLLIVGLMFGAMFGVAGALLVEYLETTAASRTEVEAILGVPVLVSVPRLHRFFRSRVMPVGGRSTRVAYRQAREAYLRLHIAIEQIARAQGLRSIAVTSAGRREGKSSVTANLAAAAASRGVEAVAVSGDLANPGIDRWFRIGRTPGLGEFVHGARDDLVVSTVDGLDVVSAGARLRSAGSDRTEERFALALEQLLEEYVLIAVDTPALSASSESVAMARYADGVLLVVDARRTGLDELDEAKRELEFAGAKVVGAVLNFVRPRRDSVSGRWLGALPRLRRHTPQ